MNRSEKQPPTPLFDHVEPYVQTLSEIDLDAVRRKFSELFDRVARAVFRAGLDLDDVLVERQVVCRIDGHPPIRISADHLSDEDRFTQHVLAAVKLELNRDIPSGAVTLMELRITAIREQRP